VSYIVMEHCLSKMFFLILFFLILFFFSHFCFGKHVHGEHSTHVVLWCAGRLHVFFFLVCCCCFCDMQEVMVSKEKR
jgi:hypothetical protein